MHVIEDTPLRTLAEKLREQQASKRDYVGDTGRMTLTTTDADWLRGDGEARDETDVRPSPRGLDLLLDMPDDGMAAFRLNRHAHGQIADHLGIPWKLYDRLLGKHPDLLADLGNGLFGRETAKRMVRTLGSDARAFLSDRYRPRDNWDLMENAILPELGLYPGTVAFKRCDLTETRMYVKVVFPDIQVPITPKVGDVVRGGMIFQNSEVGAGSLGIYPYTDVLACTNGMVHTEFGQRSVHLGRATGGDSEAWELFSDETLALDDAAFFSKCRDTVRAIVNESVFHRIADQMKELAGLRLDGDPRDRVVELAQRHSLTEAEGGSIMLALIEGADLSGWGYVNAITRTARDMADTDADRATELETLAGRLVSDRKWAAVAA